MSLKDWITGKKNVATAIPAIPATEGPKEDKFDKAATAIPAIPLLEKRENLPSWCTGTGCGAYEEIDLPRTGRTAGCVYREFDMETWRRLDRLDDCPACVEHEKIKTKGRPITEWKLKTPRVKSVKSVKSHSDDQETELNTLNTLNTQEEKKIEVEV